MDIRKSRGCGDGVKPSVYGVVGKWLASGGEFTLHGLSTAYP